MKKENTIQFKKEVEDWLKDPNHDFDEGFNLFVRFSHNRALAMQLARKRPMSKLVYELEKIIKRVSIIEKPVMPIKPVQRIVARAQASKPAPGIVIPPISDDEKMILDAGKVLAAAEDRFDPDKLPEELKKLWDENKDRHKQMRSIHEKMKLVKSDEERFQQRKNLIYQDDKIAENWKLIDAWKPGGNIPTSQTTKSENVKDPVGTAKTFVSRNLKKAIEETDPVKKEKQVAKLKERVAILTEAGHEFKGETLEKLKTLGLIQ